MLSLSNVGTGTVAATYYESADDYYSRDNCQSTWWGAGADSLGLSGGVEHAVFANLLDGILPNGELLQHAIANRRGGTDATFSAPKSVSLQALIGGDQRVIDAHRIAVDRALTYAEQFASCRVTKKGITKSVRTGCLLVARFDHDLSRTNDPQLHTHCVLLNATEREDGQWRSMNNEPIYRRKMLLGALYRAELARELQGLGYGIRLTHLDGRFELAHIDDAQVRAFSKRSTAIEEYLKGNGLERGQASAELKKLAALATREKKTLVDRDYLRQEWQGLSNAQGINYQPRYEAEGLASDPKSASLVLQNAIAHLSERQAVFDHVALMGAALASGVGRTTLADIEPAIAQAIEKGALIHSGDRYTTPSMQLLESQILDMELQGRSAVQSIYQRKKVDLVSQLGELSGGQRQAVMGILLSRNQVTGVQGRAGTGKTTLLRKAAAVAEASGYQVRGLAPSASAVRELAAAGIDAETIAAFSRRLAKCLTAKTVLIVDEAGMASTRQMHGILTAAREAQCRIVLVGDTAQLQAVEAGKPFMQLQAAGMHTSVVSEIQRQKSTNLKRAVELAVDGQAAMAIELLDKYIVQIREADQRFAQIANDYSELSLEERESTLVVAGTRWARREINLQVREKLGLIGTGQSFALLDRKDHTEEQRRSILAYEAGDIVMADADYKTLGLKRGDVAIVVERRGHRVMLQRADGEQVAWQPAVTANLTAFTPTESELAVGELVRVTSNDPERGLINGDMGRITVIDAARGMLTLSLKDGREVELDGRQPLALGYGYCSTVHASQGQTCERVLIEADANSLTANQRSWYVAISRARQMAKIYTDDREMLPFAMTRELTKESALDLTRSNSRSELENCHD